MADTFAYLCLLVLGFSVVDAALGGGGQSAAWRVVWAVAGTLLVLVCALIVVFSVRGLASDAGVVLVGVVVAVLVNAGRRSGLFDWVVQNRRQAAGVGAALLLVVASGAWFAGRDMPAVASVPLVPLAVAGPSDENSAVVASVLPASRRVEGCPCGGVDLCEGPRGGRYCLTDAGAKRYK